MKKIKLFCFPYAGGSTAVFGKWKAYFEAGSGIEIIPVELRGRGRRVIEPLYGSLEDAVEDLYQAIKVDIKDSHYAFFGHSLGALIAYELALKIKHLHEWQPTHVFFSGRSAPGTKFDNQKKYHSMSDEEFKREVFNLGGTPPEVFEHRELLEFFLPVLRNDFKLAETYYPAREIDPFNCNISVFMGKEDYKVPVEQANAWKLHTIGTCSIYYFNGGHFFLNDQISGVTQLIRSTLEGSSLSDSESYFAAEKRKIENLI